MQFGICALSIVPVKLNADDTAEVVTQLLYGEHFKILEARKSWSRIRSAFDKTEGWVLNSQISEISKEAYEGIGKTGAVEHSSDLVSFVSGEKGLLIPIVMGSSVSNSQLAKHCYEGDTGKPGAHKDQLINFALNYLHAPYLRGGRTPFGIDAPGLTQMVYKLYGVSLARTALDQSGQGEALSFIEESEAGDLAFFDNKEGVIDHVGLIMQDNYIIHVNGRVRIDRLDHTGIFNTEVRNYTHKLRVIKKII
ncbi:C40 family peptidase [Poritiphilus flavus]|uniref:SH3 domain-containing protein n=1 Tax=Poritiphilus flavus TaxID=2697053 RepID=A0A6L9EBW0_9FLAO|nr:NlpC/P60 family protein [Poritiphilus flavus]NAS12122.1 SH3 domain-containing protein [Poritiphilus flavus]